MHYVYKNEYIYVLNCTEFQGEVSSNHFDPNSYEFSDGDYRMSIKLVKKKFKKI